ncbi:MAG TPA: bifunctional phosphoribosylaminoimidazolecarboxamide formyltransferase/IMP cyclohydrolase [Kiritimatiellae bacterium]|nr:bifunctional phosphoribosylaminoimidazolecarboxamide formyltransferase/IMP cyclohydrolase [Kiritimatiellia bacterium]
MKARRVERALLSVYDKSGIVDFARGLDSLGIEIVSTGGTARTLREAGIPVLDISELTGFPEILDGRVKTLHPAVQAGILYRRDDPQHAATLRKHQLKPVDLVCVNLYPFERTVARPEGSFAEAMENIDVGGPTMIRAAAKNHAHVTAVIDPEDYPLVLEQLRSTGDTTPELRRRLARKVFARTAKYDAAIARYLSEQIGEKPPFLAVFGEKGAALRYGENPHQKGFVYARDDTVSPSLVAAEQLHGKQLSYNNYLDGDAALAAVGELAPQTAVAIIKHGDPCGYATGESVRRALESAWAGDPVSAFGSVIAFSRPVDGEAARFLQDRFVEVLIAPDFSPEALEILTRRQNVRLLRLAGEPRAAERGWNLRSIGGGILVQSRDAALLTQWMVPTEHVFPEVKRPLAEFGIRACKYVKSNAVVIVCEYEPGQFMLLGMGAGQPNRVDAVRKLALPRALENIGHMYEADAYGSSPQEFANRIMREAVLVSDAFFPFADSIEHAAQAGIRYIVQPGGSRRDEEVIAACDRFGIAMVFTGMRHFLH